MTYIHLHDGWLLLMVVLNSFSHYIFSLTQDDALELPFVLSAARQAFA